MNRYIFSQRWKGSFFLWLVALSGASALANNVKLVREGELVKITGDMQPNSITVTQSNTGNLTVTGSNGTLVNGQPSDTLRGFAINAMEVLMNGGNDRVSFSNVRIANDLFINLGTGNDLVLTGGMPSLVGANCTIEGDLGTETVRLTGWTIGGDLNVFGGTGLLNATLSQLSVGFGLTVIGDSLNDSVSILGCEIGDITTVETKSGADKIAVTDFIGFGLSVSTDTGIDQVSMTNVVTLEDIGVNTGTEGDSVVMTTVSSGKNILVSLDAGADSFVGTSVSAAFDAVFEGGAGTDTFGDFGVFGVEKTEIKEFEIFL